MRAGCVASILIGTFAAVVAQAVVAQVPIQNPYFPTRNWVVWEPGDDLPSELRFPAVAERRYPGEDPLDDFVAGPNGNKRYAGLWGDVYVSQDNFHSRMRSEWQDGQYRIRIDQQVPVVKRGYFEIESKGGKLITPMADELRELGASFTSQSTSGMGHDIANNPVRSFVTEREFFFANVLRTGPAHVSLLERYPTHTEDRYWSLLPCLYNSIGSSGSETWALTKMAIAGANLRPEVKRQAKMHGVYPATLLYLWKAALPYDVPFEHELRHRVAYYSKGDHSDYHGSTQVEFNHWAHAYDEQQHLKQMVGLARGLQSPPPVAVISQPKLFAGEGLYALRTSVLIKQRENETVRFSFTVDESYDLAAKELDVQVHQICGNPNASVTRSATGEFTILVPADRRLPQGRTSFLVVADNGEAKSNPAVINVFKEAGEANRRPQLRPLSDQTVLLGEQVDIQCTASDPEGYPLFWYSPSQEVGSRKAENWSWQADRLGRFSHTVIVSDRTSGNGLNSDRCTIDVRQTISEIQVDRHEGSVPLTIRFSGQNSRDIQRGQLSYQWNFDDGSTAKGPAVRHTFAKAGFYRVTLAVKGPSAEHKSQIIVHAKPDWDERISLSRSDWQLLSLDCKPIWEQTSSRDSIKFSPRNVSDPTLSVKSIVHPQAPYYLNCKYRRGRDNSGAKLTVSGVEFGNLLDVPSVPGYGTDMSIRYTHRSNGSTSRYVLRQPRFPTENTELSVYLSADPNHPSCQRLRGFVRNEVGEEFISIDAIQSNDDPVQLIEGVRGGTQITRLSLYSPNPQGVPSP